MDGARKTARNPSVGVEPMAALAERGRAGDRSALEELLVACDDEVLNVAYRLLNNKDDAMDIRQQTSVRVWQGLGGFDGRSAFRTWLLRIVVNLCRDHIRRSGAERRRADGWKAQAAPAHSRNSYQGVDDNDAHEQNQRVAECVGELSEAQREVLVLRHYHDMTLTGVAELLEIPLSTAASRLTSGLRKLRELLSDDEEGGVSGGEMLEKGAGHAV